MTAAGWIVLGVSCSSVVGRVERSCRPIRSCAGDAKLSTGVDRYSNIARSGLLPSVFALSSIFLTVWTVFSASPLDCGYPGLDAMCLKSQDAAKSDDAYCGPLSLMAVSGMQWRAKWADSFCMTAADVVEVSSSSSK